MLPIASGSSKCDSYFTVRLQTQAAHKGCCACFPWVPLLTLSMRAGAPLRSCSPHTLQPSHLTLSWTSQAHGGCPPMKEDADGKPGPCSSAPAPTFVGRDAENLKDKPGDALGWLSLGQGKPTGCWGRDILGVSLRKLLSCLKRLFPYWHSGSTTWSGSVGPTLEPSRRLLCCTGSAPLQQGAA